MMPTMSTMTQTPKLMQNTKSTSHWHNTKVVVAINDVKAAADGDDDGDDNNAYDEGKAKMLRQNMIMT